MITVTAAVGLILIVFWGWAAWVARRWKKTADELAERSWPIRKFDAGVDSAPTGWPSPPAGAPDC